MTSGIQHRTYAAYVTHTLRIDKSLLLCTVFMAAAPSAYAAADEAEQARQLVERADDFRFPRDSFHVDVTITNSGESSGADVHKYRIHSKGNEDTLVTTTEPPSERGQIKLLKGRAHWVFMPAVSP